LLSLISHKEAHKVIRLEEYLEQSIEVEDLPDAIVLNHDMVKPNMVTLQIDGGKKQKLRPGDIVGALTAGKNISFDQVGKIAMFPIRAYVAVHHEVANIALKKISEGKMKGRNFRVRKLG
jgi:ATP-independent RNA helicase DbpA